MALHKQDNYDIEFIQSLINNGTEESINIDFKAAGALSKEEIKKKEISKDVSAFANSNGGLIIYGLTEKNHKADSFSFIDGNVYTKEWLEQVISTTIQRNIEGLKIFPIRNNGNIEESIYVVQIPESLDAPHMNKDKKFYRRFDFQSVAMEEYEVRNLYGRKSKSQLLIDGYNILYEETVDKIVKFLFRIDIFNNGDLEESNYKINTYFKNFTPKVFDLNWRKQDTNKSYNLSSLDNNTMKVSNIGNSIIFSKESMNISHFYILINESDLSEVFEKMEISFKLLYSGGEDNYTIDPKFLMESYNCKILYEGEY